MKMKQIVSLVLMVCTCFSFFVEAQKQVHPQKRIIVGPNGPSFVDVAAEKQALIKLEQELVGQIATADHLSSLFNYLDEFGYSFCILEDDLQTKIQELKNYVCVLVNNDAVLKFSMSNEYKLVCQQLLEIMKQSCDMAGVQAQEKEYPSLNQAKTTFDMGPFEALVNNLHAHIEEYLKKCSNRLVAEIEAGFENYKKSKKLYDLVKAKRYDEIVTAEIPVSCKRAFIDMRDARKALANKRAKNVQQVKRDYVEAQQKLERQVLWNSNDALDAFKEVFRKNGRSLIYRNHSCKKLELDKLSDALVLDVFYMLEADARTKKIIESAKRTFENTALYDNFIGTLVNYLAVSFSKKNSYKAPGYCWEILVGRTLCNNLKKSGATLENLSVILADDQVDSDREFDALTQDYAFEIKSVTWASKKSQPRENEARKQFFAQRNIARYNNKNYVIISKHPFTPDMVGWLNVNQITYVDPTNWKLAAPELVSMVSGIFR